MKSVKPKSIEWGYWIGSFILLTAGIGWELWYTTRENKSKQYHFIQFGYVIMEQEESRFMVLTLTLLVFNFKVGWRIY